MGKPIAVGIWTFDAGDLFGDGRSEARTKTVDERLAYLRAAAERLLAFAGGVPGEGSFDAILAAPEYFFSARDGEGKRLPLTEADRLSLEVKLQELSRHYPRMLMFPGTLFYAKELIRPEGAGKKFGPSGLRDTQKTTGADRRERYAAKLQRAIDEAPKLFDNPHEAVTHWSQDTKDDSIFSPPLSHIHHVMGNRDHNPKVVRNAAYVLLNGRRIAKYDKRADFFETRGSAAEDLAFVPGTERQCPVLDGYRIGVEICYDHQIGALARRGVNDLRLHVLLSDPTTVVEANMAMMKGGYFLHASTDYKEAGLWERQRNGVIRKLTLGADSQPIVSCDDMYLYKIELN